MLHWLSADLKVRILIALLTFDYMAWAMHKIQPFLTLSVLLLGPASECTAVLTEFWLCAAPLAGCTQHFINILEEESEVLNAAKFLVKTALWGLVHKPNGWLIGSMHPICIPRGDS